MYIYLHKDGWKVPTWLLHGWSHLEDLFHVTRLVHAIQKRMWPCYREIKQVGRGRIFASSCFFSSQKVFEVSNFLLKDQKYLLHSAFELFVPEKWNCLQFPQPTFLLLLFKHAANFGNDIRRFPQRSDSFLNTCRLPMHRLQPKHPPSFLAPSLDVTAWFRNASNVPSFFFWKKFSGIRECELHKTQMIIWKKDCNVRCFLLALRSRSYRDSPNLIPNSGRA